MNVVLIKTGEAVPIVVKSRTKADSNHATIYLSYEEPYFDSLVQDSNILLPEKSIPGIDIKKLPLVNVP